METEKMISKREYAYCDVCKQWLFCNFINGVPYCTQCFESADIILIK